MALRIATWNIAGIKARIEPLLKWLGEEKPDIVVLQEIKTVDEGFPRLEIEALGYNVETHGQKSWNGVAILARDAEPILTRNNLPGDPADAQSRYIEAAVNGVLIGCLYAPNGNPQPGPKFDYKLAWLARLARHAHTLLKSGAPVALVGDYNVVPAALDIYPTKSWDDDALVQPQSRAAFQRIIKQGWTDALRKLHPAEPMYTFWDYMRKRWPNDKGLRLDHFLLSPDLAKRLRDGNVDRWVRGEPNASDHAPAWIELTPLGKRRLRGTTRRKPAQLKRSGRA
jgi:exodeoxyribonuclease-3